MAAGGLFKECSIPGNLCAPIDISSFNIWQFCPVLIDPFGVAFAKWSELGGGIQSEVTETRNRTKFPNTSESSIACTFLIQTYADFQRTARVSGIYFPAFSSVKCVFFWYLVVFAFNSSRRLFVQHTFSIANLCARSAMLVTARARTCPIQPKAPGWVMVLARQVM